MLFQRYLRFIIFAVAVVVFVFSPQLIDLIVDYLFYLEVGFENVYRITLISKAGLFIVGSVVAFTFFISNVLFAVRSKIPWVASVPKIFTGGANQIVMSQGTAKKFGFLISLILSLIVGGVFSVSWNDLLLYFNQEPFGTVDTLFNTDISYYIFSLPIFELLISVLRILFTVSLLVVGFIYFVRGSFFPLINIRKFSIDFKNIKSNVRWHLGFLLMGLFFTSAANIYLSWFDLMYKSSGVIYGATYTDVVVLLPFLKVLLVSAGLVAIAAMYFAVSGKTRFLSISIFAYLIISIASTIIPELIQRFIVTPNELVRETPYIENHIEATRLAYDLDQVEMRQLEGATSLTREDIENNDATVKNVRLWDRNPLLSTFSQIQEIRTYYEFNSVTNDRYIIDGELRQLMLSPRELDSSSLPTQNWINTHLTFTHGYGLTAGPVNQVTAEGLPVLYVKDLPPQTEKDELMVTRPELYYGLIANEYVIVRTESQEFDYPKGDEQIYTTYEGKGGVLIDSLWKRILYAIKFQSINIVLNDDITDESRIIYNRQIVDRIKKLAPFLMYDSDPYMVVDNGKIYWVLDAYTTSNRYPYAQPVIVNGKSVNYMRNSVKVIVDAYDGSIDFYKVLTDDPIINAYDQIFDGMFTDYQQMPDGLKVHMRYPEDIFKVQSDIFTIFHMTEPQIFYNREDQWEIPSILDGESASNQVSTQDGRLSPRHMIMELPEEDQEEYILMLPFTPRAKDNLAAWMVARNDGEEYGQIRVYSFPKDKLVFGPRQIIGRINQDADVSRQITLWDQRGSQVIQGPLLVIPIESSLIYVRPLYLKASDGKIPELKRVIVAYENKIAMGETLEGALGKIFRDDDGQTDVVDPIDAGEEDSVVDTQLQSKIERAQTLYNQALDAQRSGDWAEYGRLIDQLGDVLSGI